MYIFFVSKVVGQCYPTTSESKTFVPEEKMAANEEKVPIPSKASRKNRERRSAQPTIDGKPAPIRRQPKRSGGAQQNMVSFNREAREERQRRKPSAGPRTPAQELVWQEENRLKYTSEERALINLLDWHETCPGSQIFDREQEKSDEEPDDEHRLFSTSLKSHKPLDHHDE